MEARILPTTTTVILKEQEIWVFLYWLIIANKPNHCPYLMWYFVSANGLT